MKTSSSNQPNERIRQSSLKRLLCRFGCSNNPEQEQAILRMAIPASVFSYLIFNKPSTNKGLELWHSGIEFVVIFFLVAVVIYISTLIIQQSSHYRRVLGILVDTIGQSYALYITGPIGAPWYGLYLWVILGNGFRYGEKYLYFATATSILGFSLVAKYTPYWHNHRGLAIGLAFTLVLIPAYSAILIRRLNEARQRADAASRAKSNFLSSMSHEIRTPLNGILGMTDLLRLRPLGQEDKECVETIHLSGLALARQIDEILDLSKIEAGRMTLEKIDFDLHALLNTTLRIFQTQAQDKGLVLNGIVDPTTPFLLSGDPHKIRQIITNLVGNAIKFTEQGKIAVRVFPLKTEQSEIIIRFEVKDTGTGIPQDQLQNIFKPFTQASDSVTRNYGGTGLGTTICKNLVELMGGNIGVESMPGAGSTFWFEIPFYLSTESPITDNNSWTSHCNAIYLAPSASESDDIASNLREWGIHHETISSPESLGNVLPSSDFDAIIINDQSASGFVERIIDDRNVSLPDGLPVIVIQKDTTPDLAKLAEDRLFVLEKPLEQNTLFNALHACYSKHGIGDDIIDFAHAQKHAKPAGLQLNVLVGDDNATNRIVLQRMLEKLGHRYTIVDGGEAVLRALEEDKYDAVITDKNMPDMGGLEVYQAYCFAHGGKSPTKFAILTADATEESRASCAAAGIEFFLTKPVSLSKFAETLAEMCGTDDTSRVDEEAVNTRENIPAENAGTFDPSEFDKLVDLSGGDIGFIRDIVNNFISDTNENIRQLETAISRHDWLTFRDKAHALKGSSLYLGLTRLAELGKELQDIEQGDFEKNGIERVIETRKAADAAFKVLRAKLDQYPQQDMTG